MANVERRMKYSLFQVENSDPFHSDHRLVIISTEPVQGRRVQGGAAKAFKFEAVWLQEETCR